MSLDYDLTKTSLPENGKGGREWTDATQSIIFATMAADIGKITDENAEEFIWRSMMFHRMHGVRSNAPAFTLDDVKQHVGLVTNVATLTQAAWWRRMRLIADRERKYSIRRHDEEFLKEIGPLWPHLIDRNHTHHINGKDEQCENLTHCPSVCDCPVDECTAELEQSS